MCRPDTCTHVISSSLCLKRIIYCINIPGALLMYLGASSDAASTFTSADMTAAEEASSKTSQSSTPSQT